MVNRKLRPAGRIVLWRGLHVAVAAAGRHYRQLSTCYAFRQLKEKLQVADFASERIMYFNTLLFPAIATIRLIARYGRRLHGEEGNPAYARKS